MSGHISRLEEERRPEQRPEADSEVAPGSVMAEKVFERDFVVGCQKGLRKSGLPVKPKKAL